MLDTHLSNLAFPKDFPFSLSLSLPVLLSPTNGPGVVFAMPGRALLESSPSHTMDYYNIVDCYTKVLEMIEQYNMSGSNNRVSIERQNEVAEIKTVITDHYRTKQADNFKVVGTVASEWKPCPILEIKEKTQGGPPVIIYDIPAGYRGLRRTSIAYLKMICGCL
jgi:hypothetical protein